MQKRYITNSRTSQIRQLSLRLFPAPAVPALAVPTSAVPVPTSSGAVSSIEVPLKAIEILSVVVAQKLKKKVDETSLSKTIKDLVGSKSTLQNEILGDLQIEFMSAPEKGEELPMEGLRWVLDSLVLWESIRMVWCRE
jgi:fatty acid synthase subunit alpha